MLEAFRLQTHKASPGPRGRIAGWVLSPEVMRAKLDCASFILLCIHSLMNLCFGRVSSRFHNTVTRCPSCRVQLFSLLLEPCLRPPMHKHTSKQIFGRARRSSTTSISSTIPIQTAVSLRTFALSGSINRTLTSLDTNPKLMPLQWVSSPPRQQPRSSVLIP